MINLSFFAKRWKIGGLKEEKGLNRVGGGREAEGGGKEGELIGGGVKGAGLVLNSGRRESVREEIVRRRESIRIEGLRRDSVKESEGRMEVGRGEEEEEARRTAGRLMEKGMGVRELVEKRVEIEKLAEIP